VLSGFRDQFFHGEDTLSSTKQASQAPASPAPLSTQDFVAEAEKLERLKREHIDLTSRLTEVNSEIRRIFGLLNGLAPDDENEFRRKVEKPRPMQDKLVISAGRAIKKAMKAKMSVEEVTEAAIAASTVVAKKYGLEKLPEPVIAAINKKVASRFNM
jgi:hypothetical protein